MDFQNIIAAVMILAAVFYVGQRIWRKMKAFSSESSCGAGCGCAVETKRKM